MNRTINKFTKGYLSSLEINPNIKDGFTTDWQNISTDIEHSTTIFLEGLPNDKRHTITRKIKAVQRRVKSKFTKQRASKKR